MALASNNRGGKPLETLLEDAARARRLAIVLDGNPAALELERYAEELEAEIRQRAAGGLASRAFRTVAVGDDGQWAWQFASNPDCGVGMISDLPTARD